MIRYESVETVVPLPPGSPYKMQTPVPIGWIESTEAIAAQVHFLCTVSYGR